MTNVWMECSDAARSSLYTMIHKRIQHISISDMFSFVGLPYVAQLPPLACRVHHDCHGASHLSSMCKFVIGHNADAVDLLEKPESVNKISKLINVDNFA